MAFLTGGANTLLATGFSVANSVRFDGSSASMKITPGSNMNLDLWTWSGWIKRGSLGVLQSIFSCDNATSDFTELAFDANDKLNFLNLVSNNIKGKKITTRVFRDPSAWSHIVLAWNSSNGTAGDRIKIYVNGVRETVFDTSDNPDSGVDSSFGESGVATLIGTFVGEASRFFNGYMAEVVLIDGAALAPTSFGEFNEDSGIWKPIDVSGLTFGTHGFYLDFEASDNLGNDANGGTDLTETNLAAVDQATDTCTNNFATLNPLVPSQGGFTPGSATYTEGATLFTTVNASSSYSRANSTILLTTGKWYVEIKYVNAGSIYGLIGITGSNATTTAAYPGVYAYDYAWYGNGGFSSGDGNFYNNNGIVRELGSGFDNNDILGMAIDLDNNTIQYYRAGSAVGSANAIAAPSATDFGGYVVCAGEWSNSSNAVFNFNFGNPPYANSSDAADGNGFGAFEYAPPSGFLAICTKNLSTVNS